MESEEHHVHFDANTDETAGHFIKIQETGSGRIVVHVGLLQIYHKYRIEVEVPRNNLSEAEDVEADLSGVPNKNCKLLDVQYTGDSSMSVAVEFTALKEKLQKESITLRNRSDSGDRPHSQVEVIFQARVLGKGKGTPMLKDGVKLLEALPNPEDSDYGSDWQGF